MRYGAGHCSYAWHGAAGELRFSYKASNIIEFWKHWHITLNRFLRKYVYIPLGGNRKGTARMYLNLFIVFLVSGIWHGAGWNFVLGSAAWCAVSGYSGMAAKAATAAVCGGCACSKWNEKIRRTFCSPTCALRHSDLPVFELYMDAVPFCKSVTGR
ncbi:MAG: MBOAT family O-acyltransferase [Gallintestinimicrobium sp.]